MLGKYAKVSDKDERILGKLPKFTGVVEKIVVRGKDGRENIEKVNIFQLVNSTHKIVKSEEFKKKLEGAING